MSPWKRVALVGVAFAAICASVAGAQDFHQNPTYATVNLNSGFTPDPNVVNVQSGGTIDAAKVRAVNNEECGGFIASAPDVRLNFRHGTLPLIISVASNADTTLVINAPDGNFYCDDDGGVNGLNPSVRFDQPADGQYDIWIGTYGNNSNQPAQVNISELSSQ